MFKAKACTNFYSSSFSVIVGKKPFGECTVNVGVDVGGTWFIVAVMLVKV